MLEVPRVQEYHPVTPGGNEIHYLNSVSYEVTADWGLIVRAGVERTSTIVAMLMKGTTVIGREKVGERVR